MNRDAISHSAVRATRAHKPGGAVVETSEPRSYDAWRREVILHVSQLAERQMSLGDARARFLTIIGAILLAALVFFVPHRFDLSAYPLHPADVAALVTICFAVSGFFCALWATGGYYVLVGPTQEAEQQEVMPWQRSTARTVAPTTPQLQVSSFVGESTVRQERAGTDAEEREQHEQGLRELFFYRHMATLPTAALLFDELAGQTDFDLEHALLAEILRKAKTLRQQSSLIISATCLLIVSIVLFLTAVVLKSADLTTF